MSEAANQDNANAEAPNVDAASGANASGVDLLNGNEPDEKQGLISRLCCSSSTSRAKVDEKGDLLPQDANKPEEDDKEKKQEQKSFREVKAYLDKRRSDKKKIDLHQYTQEDEGGPGAGGENTEDTDKFLNEIEVGIAKGLVHETLHLVQKDHNKEKNTNILIQEKPNDAHSDLPLLDQGDQTAKDKEAQKNLVIKLKEYNDTEMSDAQTTTVKQIDQCYKRNTIHALHQEIDKSDKYLEKVMKIIPLNELYEVIDYIVVCEDSNICPVLLEVMHKDIKRKEEVGSADNVAQFLLQLWRREDGVMMFERKLSEPPHGWGIHKNSFFYIDSDKSRINEVICHFEEGQNKGHATANSHELTSKYLTEFELNEHAAENIEHEGGEEEKDSAAADGDSKDAKNWFEKDQDELNKEEGSTSDHDTSEQEEVGEQIHQENEENQENKQRYDGLICHRSRKLVNSFKTKEFIKNKQVPLKIARVGNSEEDYRLIVATRKSFVELIIDEKKVKQYNEAKGKIESQGTLKKKGIEPSSEIAKVIKIQKNYEFVQFINIGNDQTAVMINNPKTNQIRYILISLDETYVKSKKSMRLQAQLSQFNKEIEDDLEADDMDDKEAGDKGVQEPLEGLPTDDNATDREQSKDAKENSADDTEDKNKKTEAPSELATFTRNHDEMTRLDTSRSNRSDTFNESGRQDRKKFSKVVYEQLGLIQQKPKSTGKLIKTMTETTNISPEGEDPKLCTVTLALRSTGVVEIYYDFEWVQTIDLTRRMRPRFCIDIQCDRGTFYLKCLKLNCTLVKNCEQKEPVDECLHKCEYDEKKENSKITPQDIEIRAIGIKWKNRMSYNYSMHTHQADWENLRLRQLNKFMRLYTQFRVFQKHVLIAHRSYISLYDLSDIDTSRPEYKDANYDDSTVSTLWQNHHKVANATIVREMFLENKIPKKQELRRDEELREHSQKKASVINHFSIRAVVDVNTIVTFSVQKGSLQEIERVNLNGVITRVSVDLNKKTGCLLKVVCQPSEDEPVEINKEENDKGDKDKVKDKKEGPPKIENYTRENQKGSGSSSSHKQVLYVDVIEKAKRHSLDDNCYKMFHLNYNEVREVQMQYEIQGQKQQSKGDGKSIQVAQKRWPCIPRSLIPPKTTFLGNLVDKQTPDYLEKQKKKFQEQNNQKSWLYKLMSDILGNKIISELEKEGNLKNMLTLNGKYQIVEMNKSWWLKHQKNIQADSPFAQYLNDSKKSQMTAQMIYQKNEYLILVPWVKKRHCRVPEPEKKEIVTAEGQDQDFDRESCDDCDNEICDTDKEDSFRQLLVEHTYIFFNKDYCSTELKDQDVLLLKFIKDQNQTNEEDQNNSFILLTNSQIRAFDDDKHELARFSGLSLSSATVVDDNYMYIQQQYVDVIEVQKADHNEDYELGEKEKIGRFSKEPGFVTVNLMALFRGHFSNLHICEGASGHNSTINRSWTSDCLAMMQSMHSICVMPLPHWNLMSFVGSRSKNQYLIWKHSSNGFFTALDKSGQLNTWSTVTGRLLWVENQNEKPEFGQPKECSYNNMKGYEVYRSDADDQTYMNDYYNFDKPQVIKDKKNETKKEETNLSNQSIWNRKPEIEDAPDMEFVEAQRSYSLSLLVSRYPIDKHKTLKLLMAKLCEKMKHESRPDSSPQDYEEMVKKEILRLADDNQDLWDKYDPTLEKGEDGKMFYRDKPKEGDDKYGRRERHYAKKLRRTKLYHFKVLELQQYEDTLRERDETEIEVSEVPKAAANPPPQQFEEEKKEPGVTQVQNDLAPPKSATTKPSSNAVAQAPSTDAGEPKDANDSKRQDFEASSVKIKYHFFHKLIQGFKKREGFEVFDWNLKSDDIRQRLYLNETALGMLEVIQNRIAILWDGETAEKSDNRLISWTNPTMIPRFPFLAAQVCSLPYWISSDFSFICDYNHQTKRMRVRETRTERKIGTLPREALHQSTDLGERACVRQAFACTNIVGKKAIETFNIETGLITYWPICKGIQTQTDNETGAKEDEDKFYLRARDSRAVMSKVDENPAEFSKRHYILDVKNNYEKADATNRILSLSERFTISQKKRAYLQAGKNVLYYPEVYKHLNSIDYASKDYCNAMSTFQIDRTFTLLDWKMAEMIEKVKEVSFGDYEAEEQMRLIHCIFMGGNSLLRMLAKADNLSEIDGKLDSFDDCNQIFQASAEGFNVRKEDKWERKVIQVPLITDCQGLQPLDYAFGMHKHVSEEFKDEDMKDNQFNRKFAPLSIKEKDMIVQSKNLQLVQTIFAHVKDYQFYYNSFNMVHPIMQAVEDELPQVFEYLNARIMKSNHITSPLQSPIQEKRLVETQSWGKCGAVEIDDLSFAQETEDQLFKTNVERSKKKIYDYFWFDVPSIFSNSKEGQQMMLSLSQTNNISVYENRAIQIIIMHQWNNFWYKKTLYIMLLPISLQIIVFTTWSCVFMPNQDIINETAGAIMEMASLLLAVYFICIESVSLYGMFQGKTEFTYSAMVELALGYLSPILILTCQAIVYINNTNLDQPYWFWYWELVAWTAFCLWIRFGVMLRSIKCFSVPIRMIQESFEKMGAYVIIVMFGVFAFTNCFQAIRQVLYITTADEENPEDVVEPPYDKDMVVKDFWTWKDKWLGAYIKIWQEIFVGALAGLEADNVKGFTDTQWLIFFVALIFNTVVLANLLLALVGGIQGSVSEIGGPHYYRQLVHQICMMQRIFFKKQTNVNRNLLFMAKVRREIEMQSDAERQSAKHNEELNNALESLNQSMHDLTAKIDKQSSKGGGSGDSKSSGGNNAKDQNTFAKITSMKSPSNAAKNSFFLGKKKK